MPRAFGFLEVLTDILNHFWVQVVVSLLQLPHGGFRSETTVTHIHNVYMYRPFFNGHACPFGCSCSGYVTAVAVGQNQRLYSGVGIFNWLYLSLPPQVLIECISARTAGRGPGQHTRGI
jgi:hypothetical protein